MRSLWQRALMLMLALLLFASAIPPLTVGAAEGGEDPLRTQGVLSPLEEKLYTEMMAEATVIDIKGLCSSREELEEAMKLAMTETGPVWIECEIDREEKVLPMIPAGGTVHDTIFN